MENSVKRIIINPISFNSSYTFIKNQRKGADVFGVPISKEIATFFEETSPESKQYTIMKMFFAGHVKEFDEEIF